MSSNNISLTDREKLQYPPFTRLLRILITGKNKQIVESCAQNIRFKLDKDPKHLKILGPSIAPIEKIKNNWRFHLLLKIEKSHLTHSYDYISKQLDFNTFYKKSKDTKIEIEVDPISIL